MLVIDRYRRCRKPGSRLLAVVVLAAAFSDAPVRFGNRFTRADDPFLQATAAGSALTVERGPQSESDVPREFFMENDVDEAPLEGAPAPALQSAGDFDPGDTARPASNPAPAPLSEFFMQDVASWTPAPVYEADAVRGPATNSVVPRRYFDAGTDWSSVPPTDGPHEAGGFRGCFDAACCAWEERWVNWRCGSDYLEGCIPEGYNALPMIRSTSPAALHVGVLNPGAPVEPGGSGEGLASNAGLERKAVSELTARIAVTTAGETPDAALPLLAAVPAERVHVPGTQRAWQSMSYYWDASHLIHQPLYFEDVNLERHGYSYGVAQPVVSAARFFGRLPLLPYALAAHPHYKAEYALGDARPGSPAPYVHVRPPRDVRGALCEAAVVTGLFFAIP
jgi:hypothetical protein